MRKTLKEVQRLLESLSERDLKRVRDFVKILLEEPENLTEEEQKDVRKGAEDFRRGRWVNWDAVRRQDV